jgi:site-specific DNA-methyltransferase (adenine-specific)
MNVMERWRGRGVDKDLVVIRGDCRKVLPCIPEGFVGLTVTDPPYESLERHRKVGTTTRLKQSKSSSNPWFEILPNVAYWKLFAELFRIHRDDTHCYVFCDSETEHVILSGRNPYDHDLDVKMINQATALATSNGPLEALVVNDSNIMQPPARGAGWRPWPTLSWVKVKRAKGWKEVEDLDDGDVHSGMGYHWRRCGERILFLEKGKRKLNELGWKDHLLGPRPGKDDAPAQKPDAVVERLILNSTAPGDLVLDPFAGSGVVGRLALKHGRRALLIDVTLQWLLYDNWPEAQGKDVEVTEW